MITPTGCQYWDCGRPIRPGHFLCHEHFLDLEDGLIDQCPTCGRFKDGGYDLCLDCYRGRVPQQRWPQQTRSASKGYEPEHSPAWAKGDKDAKQFYVYILKLDGPKFYVGQTRDLRARLSEHRDNKEPATAGRHPTLQYFNSVPTREAAANLEVELKEMNDTNEREIRKMIIGFKDMVKELEPEQPNISRAISH